MWQIHFTEKFLSKQAKNPRSIARHGFYFVQNFKVPIRRRVQSCL